MARRAANGGDRIYEDGAEVDTFEHDIVKILMIGTAAGASVAVTVGDVSGSLTACPAEDLVDIDTGKPITLSGGDGDAIIASYIGYCRYISATGTNATVMVELEEARDSGPDPE